MSNNVNPNGEAANLKNLKLIILLLLLVIGLSATFLFIDYKQAKAFELSKAESEKVLNQAKQSFLDWQALNKDGKIVFPLEEDAKRQLDKAVELFSKNQFQGVSIAGREAISLTNTCLKQREKFFLLNQQVKDINQGLETLSQAHQNIESYVNQKVKPLKEKLSLAEISLASLNFDVFQESVKKLKAEIFSLKKHLVTTSEAHDAHWLEALKDDTKESLTVFNKSFPYSSNVIKSKNRIEELIEIQRLKEIEEERLKRQQEEELKKQKESIAKRKAELEREIKQKRELEQVKTVQYDDGSSYTGQMNGTTPHGEGTYSYQNSNVYKGQWKDGKYHGQGRYSFYTGVSYEGQWYDGNRHGEGKLTWPNGDTFIGKWQAGQIHGRGVWKSTSGSQQVLNYYQGIELGRLTYAEFKKRSDYLEERYKGNRMSKGEHRVYHFLHMYEEALETLRRENSTMLIPDFPVFIPGHQSFKNSRSETRTTEKHKALLKKYLFEIKRYVLVTKNAMGKDEEFEYQSSEMGGYEIVTAKLGVILDNSGSMQSYLEDLREKIDMKFANSAYMEVTGCSLYDSNNEISKENAERNTLLAIKYLVLNKGVDTIYWFSDLNDLRTDEALDELSYFLERNFVTFYLTSVGKTADSKLRKIVLGSGGKILKK